MLAASLSTRDQPFQISAPHFSSPLGTSGSGVSKEGGQRRLCFEKSGKRLKYGRAVLSFTGCKFYWLEEEEAAVAHCVTGEETEPEP